MLTYSYLAAGKAGFCEKEKPHIIDDKDAIVRVTLSSICTSDLHIIHGSVPRAVTGVTLGHEAVGVVEQVGKGVKTLSPGDRVAVNVETFCGECYFCRHGWVNNCTDKNGGWALGCRIDGMQAPFVRVPYADTGLSKIPDNVTDRQALLSGTFSPRDIGRRTSPKQGEGTTCLFWAEDPRACAARCARTLWARTSFYAKKAGAGVNFCVKISLISERFVRKKRSAYACLSRAAELTG